MRPRLMWAAALAVVAVTRPSVAEPAAAAGTAAVVTAADAFVATLDAGQRGRLLFKFDDVEQRARWSNFPTGFVPRGGLSLREMTDPQRAAAMALVKSALSDKGFEKVQQIMGGDEVLKSQPDDGPGGGGPPGGGRGRRGGRGPRRRSTTGPADRGPNGGPDDGPPGRNGPGGFGGGPGGGGSMFGADLYYISILGTPSATAPWMLQFGGHHLAINLTIVGGKGVLTPTLTGAQPALYKAADGTTVRPLAGENDRAFVLLDALDPGQRKRAILNYEVADLVLGPGHDGQTVQPEGLRVADMTDRQRGLLMDVVGEWAGIVNDGYAAPRLAEIKAGLGDTYFAWSGPTTHEPGKNGTAYYRIQGPTVVIEFSPQPIGGDLTNHVHTMYRDPTDDYGRADANR